MKSFEDRNQITYRYLKLFYFILAFSALTLNTVFSRDLLASVLSFVLYAVPIAFSFYDLYGRWPKDDKNKIFLQRYYERNLIVCFILITFYIILATILISNKKIIENRNVLIEYSIKTGLYLALLIPFISNLKATNLSIKMTDEASAGVDYLNRYVEREATDYRERDWTEQANRQLEMKKFVQQQMNGKHRKNGGPKQ